MPPTTEEMRNLSKEQAQYIVSRHISRCNCKRREENYLTGTGERLQGSKRTESESRKKSFPDSHRAMRPPRSTSYISCRSRRDMDHCGRFWLTHVSPAALADIPPSRPCAPVPAHGVCVAETPLPVRQPR